MKKIISFFKELWLDWLQACPIPGSTAEWAHCPCDKKDHDAWIASGGRCRFG